jgi:hypothetical protein
MALRDSDIPIVHSTDDGYALNDLHAARLMVIITGESRQAADTMSAPRLSMAYDEEARVLRYTAVSRDGSRTAVAALHTEDWQVTSEDEPAYDQGGVYEDGWRKDVATHLLIAVGVLAPPQSRWARLFRRG